jgi:hypothetical protein
MTKHEKSYLLARAEEEIGNAQQSVDARAVAAHFELAERYLDMAYGEPEDAASAE